ncbi:acyltransferase family protein [Pseudogemmobacter humi]|uniref:Inner membrane protein YcfT n=1 Tax=Pseudogemmobacter humi TaxID=2483812 RepID=A0A3P5XMI1_9RHOB|nr:acyltransferase family protein [Pseudogemmobacter humi]VDC32970.1 Inner membrane protein YcfT [Pseudogemmobacter humi]
MAQDGRAPEARILWIDAVRGITITLVVLFHAAIALATWFPATESNLPEPLIRLTALLGLVRMPAFFFCSGLVFSFAIARGWRWFLARRLRFALWIVAVWTGISLAVERSGLHLYPQYTTPFILPEQLLWVPYGNLWFIYAMLLVSALALLLRPLPLAVQHLLVLGLGVLAMLTDRHVVLPEGLRLLAGGLAEDALVFFMLGVWWGPSLIRFLDDPRIALAAGFALPALGLSALNMIAPVGIWLPILVMLPMTTGFLAMIRIFSVWEPGTRFFAMIGRRSLEIFLLHQFFLAAVFALLERFAPGMPPVTALLLLWLVPLAGSVRAARILRARSGPLLFDAPAWLKLPTARRGAERAT